MKKLISVFCILFTIFSFSACTPNEEDYLSGVSNEPPVEEDENEFARYENQLYGIILEYPETYERIGNFDADGYISFEGDGNAVFIYVPDDESDLLMTTEEYAYDILNLPKSENAATVTYGKTTGFRTFSKAGGRITVEFVVRGLNAFYRFAYASPESLFSEDDPIFSGVMASIRIDDGKYTLLNKMLAEYTILLEYATSMQYATDANYANHCLNTFETSGEESYLKNATDTFTSMKEKLDEICTHVQGEGESFPDLWNKISATAKRMSDACSSAISAIETGNMADAQKISRTDFTYDLSDSAEMFISAIDTEIGEY